MHLWRPVSFPSAVQNCNSSACGWTYGQVQKALRRAHSLNNLSASCSCNLLENKIKSLSYRRVNQQGCVNLGKLESRLKCLAPLSLLCSLLCSVFLISCIHCTKQRFTYSVLLRQSSTLKARFQSFYSW